MSEIAAIPGPPSVVPSAGDALGRGWRQLWKNFWMLLLAGIVVVAIAAAVSWVLSLAFSAGLIGLIGSDWSTAAVENAVESVAIGTTIGFGVGSVLVQFLFFNHLYAGLCHELLLAARGDRVEIGALFRPFRNYWHVALALFLPYIALMAVGAAAAGLVVLVPVFGVFFIPAYWVVCILVACKLAFLPFLLVDRRMKAVPALRGSWNMTRGHAGKVFVIVLPLIGYFIVIYLFFMIAAFAVGSVAFANGPSTSSALGFVLAAIVFVAVFLVGGGIMAMWTGTSVAALYDAVDRGLDPVPLPDDGSPEPNGLMNSYTDSQEPEVS